MRAIVLAALLTTAGAAIAYDPVVDVRKIMAGTVTTTKVKNEYLSGKRDGTAPFQGALKAYKDVRAAEIQAPVPVPVPAPQPPVVPLSGLAPITSNFDINTELGPSWGTGAIAPSGVSHGEFVGAFRFICGPGQLLKDDPIVYPGQPGASHLHQFYGHVGANAHSTYESLRKDGLSTCMSPLNRSAYWMPAMLDGKGNVIRPDYVAIYYKRRPISDPKCSRTSGDPKAEGDCVDLPNGLKFIFGFDMVTGKSPTGGLYFNCDGPGSTQGHYASIPAAKPYCAATVDVTTTDTMKRGKLGAVIHAPACWDGKNLDSPNHRDHVAYKSYGSWGYLKCPDTHPYVIPEFTLQAWYSIVPGDDLNQWKFASDAMKPDLPNGSTYHADFFMAWDPTVKKMWHDNCINKLLSCSGGDLGNGKQMKNFAGFSWAASPRLVSTF